MRGIMSTLFQPSANASLDRNPADDRWFHGHVSTPVASGAHVTPDSALRVSALWACIKVISESVAMLPIKIYSRQPNGDKREERGHYLFDLLHDSPNDNQTAYEWKLQAAAYLSAHGNSVNEIVSGRRGPFSQLVPHHPDDAHPRITPNGDVVWRVHENGTYRDITADRIFHIRGTPWLAPDGVKALSPIDVEREAVGDAMAARDYSARYWANDGTPPSYIKHPSHFRDKESKDNFVRSWQAAQGGRNRHRTAVLEHGMELHTISLTNEQAQFLETRKYQDVDIARIFRVPPHKIGILDRATFSNIEQQSIEFVVDTLGPWLVCIEQAIKKHLIDDPQYFAEFNVNALLRGDILSRYQAYAIGRNWGWLSANDVRSMENQNSIGEDGDQYLRPTNMSPADSPAEPSGQGAPRRTNQDGRRAFQKPQE